MRALPAPGTGGFARGLKSGLAGAVAGVAAQLVQGVGQGGQDHLQALQGALGRAGQIHDKGGPPDAADSPGEHGMGGVGQAPGPHGLGQAGRQAAHHGQGGLGGVVAGAQAGAAAGEHQAQIQLVGQAAQGGLYLGGLVGHGLAVGDLDAGGGQ